MTETNGVRRYVFAQKAAKWGGCGAMTIIRLAKAGHLKAEQLAGDSRKRWAVYASKDEIVAAVKQHAPRSGYKKASAKINQPTPVQGRVAKVLAFASYDEETLDVLATLAAAFTLADLKTLISLSDKK